MELLRIFFIFFYKITIFTNFVAFFLLQIFNFSLLDPDSQPWAKRIVSLLAFYLFELTGLL